MPLRRPVTTACPRGVRPAVASAGSPPSRSRTPTTRTSRVGVRKTSQEVYFKIRFGGELCAVGAVSTIAKTALMPTLRQHPVAFALVALRRNVRPSRSRAPTLPNKSDLRATWRRRWQRQPPQRGPLTVEIRHGVRRTQAQNSECRVFRSVVVCGRRNLDDAFTELSFHNKALAFVRRQVEEGVRVC